MWLRMCIKLGASPPRSRKCSMSAASTDNIRASGSAELSGNAASANSQLPNSCADAEKIHADADRKIDGEMQRIGVESVFAYDRREQAQLQGRPLDGEEWHRDQHYRWLLSRKLVRR